ncbi:MAG TPA: SDR family oxidoreductase [Bacteroidales bacterium]|nr:SDR family oxidoreductase [Bacteroidales bacterium]
MIKLENKHILVLGANSEIGYNNALHLSNSNAIMHLTAKTDDKINKLKSDFGDKHFYYKFEANNYRDIDAFVKQLQHKIDGVIFSIGYSKMVAARLVKEKSLEDLLFRNFKIHALLSRSLLRRKKINDNASLVYYTSVSYQKHFVGNAIYSSAKVALSNYVKALAIELINSKIRVNSIAPGLVKTKSLDSINIEYIKNVKKQHPRGFTLLEEVSETCLFLLSSASRGIHGQEIIVDNGYSISI